MIEGVGPVEAVEAVSLSVLAGMGARQGAQIRRRRLGWLAALRAAQGEGSTSPEEASTHDADERLLQEMRERIAAAVRTAEQIRNVSGEREAPSQGRESALPIPVAELARRMGVAGERCLGMQARLGAVAVLGLVAPQSRIAMNGM